MSPLLLYGVAEPAIGAGVSGAASVAGAALRAISESDLAAVVSEHAVAPSAASTDALWEYEGVVERLMRTGALLPARFGSVLADESAVRALLRERAPQLRLSLERVRGAVELSVRATWHDVDPRPSAARAGSGTDYLLGRLDRQTRARALAARLETLSAGTRAARVREQPREDIAAVGAYLVDRPRVQRFARQVAELDERLGDAALVCTGPWPPYSFSEAAAA